MIKKSPRIHVARHAISIMYYRNLGITYNRKKSWKIPSPPQTWKISVSISSKRVQDLRKLGGSHNNIRFWRITALSLNIMKSSFSMCWWNDHGLIISGRGGWVKIARHFLPPPWRVIPYQIDQKYQMLVGTISDFDETFHTCTSIWEMHKSKIFFRSDLKGPSYGGRKFWPRGKNAFFQMPVD